MSSDAGVTETERARRSSEPASRSSERPAAVSGTPQKTPSPDDVAPAVRLEGLRKSFRSHLSLHPRLVLRELSLSVRRGTIHGLLGPNGAGKTTTLRILLGLLRPDAGRAEIFGRPAHEPEARCSLGFLPENPYFYDYLTAREFLNLSARLAGVSSSARRARVAQVLVEVGMAGRDDVPLRRCSKGMVQRVGLAQALVGDPDLLVLDEPMSGLDPIGRREFRDLILARRSAGKTVFFSSHILQDAEMICDRVSILDGGRLVAEGDLAELLGGETAFWEVTVTGCDPAALAPHWEGVAVSAGRAIGRVRSEGDLDQLLRRVHEAGGAIRAVVPSGATLEDLFLRLIGPGSAAGAAGARDTGGHGRTGR